MPLSRPKITKKPKRWVFILAGVVVTGLGYLGYKKLHK